MSKSLIIPIFIPYQGCPRRCIYCNERITTGDPSHPPTADVLKERVLSYLRLVRKKPTRVEIAFYGGTFTGMAREAQQALLGPAAACVREGLVQSIRISTRPDEIDEENADFLWAAGVRTVEIGAQSLDDDILERSRRGHTAGDVIRAVTLLKAKGFITGMHLMIGLPGEDRAAFAETISRTVALRPDMVRLHPTLVFRDTALAEMYLNRVYSPLTLKAAIAACKLALRAFEPAGIPVIRLGLQTTAEMEAPGSVLAGPFHPALRTLVEESIAVEMATRLLTAAPVRHQTICFIATPIQSAHLRGRKSANLLRLHKDFELGGVQIVVDPGRSSDSLTLALGERTWQTNRWDLA